MFEALKHYMHERTERRRSTDFGTLDMTREAEEKNRQAHDSLMGELEKLSEVIARAKEKR